MSKLILFYCFFEDPSVKIMGAMGDPRPLQIRTVPLQIRIVVKATTPREAKELAEEHVKEYHIGYKFRECVSIPKGSRVIEASRLVGRAYSDGMLGPV